METCTYVYTYMTKSSTKDRNHKEHHITEQSMSNTKTNIQIHKTANLYIIMMKTSTKDRKYNTTKSITLQNKV